MCLLPPKHRTFHLHPSVQCSEKALPSVDFSRSFSKVTDNNATELYFEEIFEHGFTGEDPLFDLRNYFYPESEDPQVIQLSHAGCVLEVLEIVTKLEQFKHQHITQAVATLHHLQKLSGFVGQADHYEDYRQNRVIFNEQLRENEMFETLCDIIHKNIEEFPHNELAFLLMALRKFSEPLSSPALRDIYLHLQKNLESLDIEALSYMSVGFRPRFHIDRYRMVWRLGLARAMPRLQHLLLNCQTPEDLRKVVICFYNMAALVSDKMMKQLVQKVTQFIESGELSSPAQLPLLCKLLALMVAKSDWHEENGDYVLLLLSQFKGKTKFLRPVNATMLSRIINTYGEPVSLYYEVYQRQCEILETKQFQGNIPMISCLNSVLRVNSSALPLKEVEEVLENIIDSHHLVDHVADVYNIMRTVGIFNNNLVDKFFMKSFEALKDSESSELLKFAVRYTNMHSKYTGTYFHKPFEEKIVDFVVKQMQGNNPISLHPIEFARRVGILITFGHHIDADMYQKFQNILPQINADGLLSIARGLEFQIRKNRREILSVSSNPVPRDQKSPYMQWIEEMSMLVSKASEAKLLERGGPDANVIDLAFLMRTNRTDFFDEEFYHFVKNSLINKVNSGNVSMKIVGQICSALRTPRVKIESPELLDCLVQFFLSRPDPLEVHTEMVGKLVSYCYDTGNKPEQKFLDVVGQGLLRDIDSLPGVSTLQLAHILCTYNSIPKPLVSALFSNEFMGKLDSEMEMSSDRKHYPKLLRKNLMELNRAVVLRNPEFGVPWFHSKFCQENRKELTITRRSLESNALKEEVSEQLHALTGGWRFVKEDSHSEYYNPIDFEVHYDERGHPVDLNSSQNVMRKVKKFAIQVLPPNAFSIDTRKMTGSFMSTTRELELQGWHVINVNPLSWNSMQMAESRAKKQYLERTIAQAVVL
eukprot:TRINITY_DN19974_c0_g1_i1.p1 TRINITY_DN19974_c0_g1~~TRINITY_DN19974_c0_g1_i1.p1  ORF type:complete len:964 (-),score=236.03 TRINITY_DN19974_c0_g1_i1:108-2897(-)